MELVNNGATVAFLTNMQRHKHDKIQFRTRGMKRLNMLELQPYRGKTMTIRYQDLEVMLNL